MTYNIISTGSKGNAVVFNDTVLVDCGVSFKALKDVYRGLRIVLLTHEHGDHFNKKTIKTLAWNRPSLRFGCCEWLVNKLIKCGVCAENIDVYEIGKRYVYKSFSLSPVKLYHDVPNCGYRLYFGTEKALYATDTSTLQGIEAKDYDLYLIEANYEDKEIQDRIRDKESGGRYAYERRVIKTHLSKSQADNFIYGNIGARGKYIYLHEHGDKYG